MVNTPDTLSPEATPDAPPERRSSERVSANHGPLGQAKLNPFGDLHTLQHLSARLARSLRLAFEGYLRAEVRCWAEPLVVERLADYRIERGDKLTAWVPLSMNARTALTVMDGRFVYELLDFFFGGTGAAPHTMPTEFSPAADAVVGRVAASIAAALVTAWEPLARVSFAAGKCEANTALITDLDAEDAVVVTRFGIARGEAKPVFVDIVYPVAALKPHIASLTGKVVAKPEADRQWQTALTRAAMTVRFPVSSVLAEPIVSLARLMNLQPGDIIPIHFNDDVPIVVGGTALGTGTVGTSNGHAAIRVTRISTEGLQQ